MNRETSDSEGEGVELEMWCYTDPKGKVRGPFPSSKMLRWRGFFFHTTLVWRYGSKKQITFGDFLRLHKIHPLWTYFDEENEPLIEAKDTEESESESDNEQYVDADEVQKNEISRENSVGGLDTDEDSEQNGEAGYEQIDEETHKEDLEPKKTPKECLDSSYEGSFSGRSSTDSEESQNTDDRKQGNKFGNLKDVDVDVGYTDNLPDRYESFNEVGKVHPQNPLEYKPYQKDRKDTQAGRVSGKENVQPIEEINPQPMYNQGAGGGYTQMPQNWNMRQMGTQQQQQQYVDPSLNYYRAVPPPLPVYLATPPPYPWPMTPPMVPPHCSAPPQVPPSYYYVSHAQPIPPNMDTRLMTYTRNTTNYPPATLPSLPAPPQYYPQQNNYYTQKNQQPQQQNYTQNLQKYQPSAVQEMHQVYKQTYGNDKGIGVFCDNLIEKYMNFTGEKMQQLYRENQKLKMDNEQLQENKKPKSIPVSDDVSFAEMVSMDNKGKAGDGKKKEEIKSFWDNVPEPKPTSVPYKKGKGFIEKKEKGSNKYPAGYVGAADGIKKKKVQPVATAPSEGVEEFVEWCLDTLNYISENKLNVEGLRVVLFDFETIACVERYIKMWLDDFNPKMWVLFNEKLKKFRKEGTSDELNSPARANPYDIERQKQKDKMQKKAELFGSNVDLNTQNINRHLTKIQQFSKKVGATGKTEK